MTILLVLLGGLVGAAFGPIGLIAGSILGATFAHSVFDDDYEPQHFALDDEDGSTLFDSDLSGIYIDDFQINPATGLPMTHGGNPYGFDLSDDFGADHSTFMDIDFSSDLHNSL